MQLGLVGLGKMGLSMAERIRAAGHEVIGYDRDPELGDVPDLPTLVTSLDAPRIVWLMLPAGEPTHDTIVALADLLDPGDLVVDGGNSPCRDATLHAEILAAAGGHFCDCGVSGGVWGCEQGYGLMVGGEAADVQRALPIFDALRPEGPRAESFVHAGGTGAGHYAKMVHNAVEYGLMHAYGEGWELLRAGEVIDNPAGCFRAWTRGTVVRSWLLELLVKALDDDPQLSRVDQYTPDSGEGRWALEEAVGHAVPTPVLAAALFARFASRQENSPTMQLVAALRGQFGGHEVRHAR